METLKFKDAKAITIPKIRWMLVIQLPDVGMKCSFPFETKAKVLNAYSYLNPLYCTYERLAKDLDPERDAACRPFLDMSVADIFKRCEEVRHEARKNAASAEYRDAEYRDPGV